MEPFSAVGTPLIGLVGVLAGILLNEYLRKGRREEYASGIFKKRLEAYEVLVELIRQGSEAVTDAIENPELSLEQRRDAVSSAIAPIAIHVDQNMLYINDELGAHCVALFMGAEDMHTAPASEKRQLLDDFYDQRAETYRMIREESGVAQIDKLFRSINRAKITSPVIERIRELRRERHRKRHK